MNSLKKSASFSDGNCVATETPDGFSISSSFDDCGFQTKHENGILTFSNSIVGQDSLFLGKETSFVVSCQFMDEREA